MNFVYLSIISSSLIVIGYLPEIYFTVFQIKNVDSTKYSSTLWLIGGILGTVYSGINDADKFIIINYSVNTSLNLLTLVLKIYYYYTPFCVENAQMETLPSLIYARLVGALNEKRCKLHNSISAEIKIIETSK